MKLKLVDPLVIKEEPFRNCKLNRLQYAEVLTDVVANYSNGFTLAINNEWGTGKTTFVKMWQQHLKNKGFSTLYFNAWENDFQDDVILTLMSEIQELQVKKNKEVFDKLVNKAAPLTKSLVSGLFKTFCTKYVGNEFVQDLLETGSDCLGTEIQEQLKAYSTRKKGINEFKSCLEEFIHETSPEKNVIFIIDELDRCRPSYAVEVLERIKHLFSVQGVVFVLSIDKEQLCHAIRGVYGSEKINSEEYLRRFIDVEFSLPAPPSDLFCDYLYNTFGFDEFLKSPKRITYRDLREDNELFITFTKMLFSYDKVSLRLQEKIFAHARISLCSFANNYYLLPQLYFFLIYIKTVHNELYKNIETGKYSCQELLTRIEEILPKNIKNSDMHSILYAISTLIHTYNNSKEYGSKEQLLIDVDGLPRLSIKSTIDKSDFHKDLLSLFGSFERFRNKYDITINHLTARIDLAQQFINSESIGIESN